MRESGERRGAGRAAVVVLGVFLPPLCLGGVKGNKMLVFLVNSTGLFLSLRPRGPCCVPLEQPRPAWSSL